jgi:trk system potassium uptake protein TrkH
MNAPLKEYIQTKIERTLLERADIFHRLTVIVLLVLLLSNHLFPATVLLLLNSVVVICIIFDMHFRFRQATSGVNFWYAERWPLLLMGLALVAALRAQHTNITFFSEIYYTLLMIRSVVIYLMRLGRNERIRLYVARLLQRPAHTIALSYSSLIIIVAIFLLLPSFRQVDAELSVLNALFIAASALCVTGLSPISVAEVFSPVGKMVLLIAIQIGGVGIALFGAIIFFVKRSVGLSSRALLAYSFSQDAVDDVGKVAKRILIITFMSEGFGALLLMWGFMQRGFLWSKAFTYGVFHSVSAFCNAGFVLFPEGSSESLRYANGLNLVFIGLTFFGTVGFGAIEDAVRVFRVRLRVLVTGRPQRLLYFRPNSVLSWTYSLGIIAITAFMFYALEHGRVLRNFSLSTQYVTTLFTVVVGKTTGMAVLDMSEFSLPTHIMFMALMFVGGASGSTAGGIKISTMLVALAGMRAYWRKQPMTKLVGSSIALEDVRRATILVISAMFIIFIATFLLSITDGTLGFLPLSWEVISALGTVGTSLNVTDSLSVTGRMIVIVLMFIGRIGALTLFVMAQERDVKKVEPDYPLGNILIG